MSNYHKSSSHVQVEAEAIVFSMLEEKLGITLEKNKPIYLADNPYTYIQPDFYSKENCIIGEIFVHIGKPKKAQDNKIANDILKMLLLDKVSGKLHRKIIVVCDDAEYNKLNGQSALAESIRQFNIEVMPIKIDDDLRNRIIEAQLRQKMTNV